ncbi:MAG TPA: hypothetical protein VFD04_22610 [Actinomycetes bacterium]|jgi:hypothetical protein|nr:hypothetical protein [Actinomycetes bacterium]
MPGPSRSPAVVALTAAAIFAVVFVICAVFVFRAEGAGQRLFGSVLLSGGVALIGTDPLLRLTGRRR